MRNKIRTLLLKLGVKQEFLEKNYIFIYRKIKQIKKPYFKLKNKIYFKLGKISEIEYILKKDLLKNNDVFGDNGFYQSYPPLNIKGERDTKYRFEKYNLEKYLDKEKFILDIGGNIGFFSLYISKFVKNIDVIEYNKNFVDIGNKLKNYEKINNVKISEGDFKLFKTTKKYNIIFSFAVHKWIGLDFEEYIKRIYELLEKDGILFLESQNLEIDPFMENLEKTKKIFELISLIDIHQKSEYKRKLAIMKKI